MILDSKIIAFQQNVDGRYFTMGFFIGNIYINIIQIGENEFVLMLEGENFKDLLNKEKKEKQYMQKKFEKEKIKIKEHIKKEKEYYSKRAAKSNDKNYYYKRKEKFLINEINVNNDKKIIKYDYNYNKKVRNDKNNIYQNNIKNYGLNNKYDVHKDINDNDFTKIKKIKNNIKRNKTPCKIRINNKYFITDNNVNNKQLTEVKRKNINNEINNKINNNNKYPSFSLYNNNENTGNNNNKYPSFSIYNNNANIEYNNYLNNNNCYKENNINNNNYNYKNNNNNISKMSINNNKIQEKNIKYNEDKYDNPSYPHINNIQIKDSTKDEFDKLINTIRNLNKTNITSSVEDCAPLPIFNKSNNKKENINYNDIKKMNFININNNPQIKKDFIVDFDNKRKNYFFIKKDNNNNKLNKSYDLGRRKIKKKINDNNNILKISKISNKTIYSLENPYKEI